MTKMTRETLKVRHDAQIDALLTDDYNAFKAAARQGNDFPIDMDEPSHYDAWVNTGGYDASLFGVLPRSGGCLTQMKGHGPYEMDGDYIDWNKELGLESNDLIPSNVGQATRFTREQLQEFSRLQLLAHFPEAAS